MNLTVSGRAVRGDAILAGTIRSDLVPVVRTVEMTLRADPDLEMTFINQGQIIEVDNSKYRVVKFWRTPGHAGVQDMRVAAAMHFIAALESVADVAVPRERALIRRSTSIGDVYRACGARVRVEQDIMVEAFACPIGERPSEGIARVLQEEAGVLVEAKTGVIRFTRLADLFKQAPRLKLSAGTAGSERSEWIEDSLIPWYYSTDASGGIVHGRRQLGSAARYIPFKTERQLRNLSTVLVRRRVLTLDYNPDLRAGDVLEVDGVPLVIITAAHAYASGADGSGMAPAAYSKYWLGALNG